MDEATRNEPEIADTATIYTLQITGTDLRKRRESGKRYGPLQVEAVARDPATTAGNNDTRGSEVHAGNLVDVKHMTKHNELSGKQDRMERVENLVVQDGSVLCSSRHKTVLHPERVVG